MAATCEAIGLRLSGEDAPLARAKVDEYLSAFAWNDGKCVCGRSLGGLLGSFTWGIVNGEGFCSRCKWPARGYHRIDMGEELGELELEYILPYDENYVRSNEESNQ